MRSTERKQTPYQGGAKRKSSIILERIPLIIEQIQQ